MTLAQTLVFLGEAWLWLGAGTAAVFLIFGIDRIDEDARGAYVFRPLLIPGILLIWPLVLWRWWTIERQGDVTMSRYAPVRRGHGAAAVAMSVAIVLVLGLGLTARQDWPTQAVPVQLSAETGE